MKKLVVLIVVLALAGVGAWYKLASGKTLQEQYRFTKVERGDLESIVSSTGTLSAVSTVQVGTQVSGTIAQLLVDFNQKVRQGQLIAVLDTTFLATAVRDAEANFERARAQLDHSDQEYRRLQTLFDKGMSAQSDLDLAQYNLDLAKAGLKSAKASLDRARVNLQYAWIYAPIDGTVIDRKVDGGQTVAASFSAPTLFLIANDLSKMQILANVDESDIGQIADGQKVRFTVQAYPQRKFTGAVAQIRLQPTTIQNVVNYTVVINVENQEGLLLPGMTATIDFLIDRAGGVLKVANAALRFKPTPEMLAALRKQMEERAKGMPDSVRGRWAQGAAGRLPEGSGEAPGRDGPPGGEREGRQARDVTRLWYLDEAGQLKAVRVKTGITDGQMTEIKTGEVEEGLEVISGLVASSAPPLASSPFPGSQPSRRMGPMF